MTVTLNETHDPARKSFVDTANAPESDFPIQNLPFGVFRPAPGASPRVGVAIGDQIVDAAAAADSFGGAVAAAVKACAAPSLNALMALGPQAWSGLRLALSRGLSADHGDKRLSRHFTPMATAELLLPATIGDFTDFYASVFHATNAGRAFRPDNPLLPNYKYVPVAYHGRASSVRVSGTPVKRPQGQRKPPNEPVPSYGPSRNMDFELELGMYIGTPTELGQTVPVGKAAAHIFGFCLLNDWSARDIQSWEYQPLGPFLAKNFATSISPWIVTIDALEPFRTAAQSRPPGDPPPLPYLRDSSAGAFRITLEVWLRSAQMSAPTRVSQSDFASIYWTLSQMIAHHTSNGCPLRPGGLIGSGTVSGPLKQNQGCLLELTRRGADPLQLPSGEARAFLEDGDEVILKGWCEASGFRRIGIGECRGMILPALGA